jgi:predicted amino acid-binding ACT domain protein
MHATTELSRLLKILSATPVELETDPRGARREPARTRSVDHVDEVAAVLSTFGRDRVGHLAAHNRALYEHGADIRRQSAHVLNGAFTLVSLVTLPHDRAAELRRTCCKVLASFCPQLSLVHGGMTLSVLLLDVPGAFHGVAEAIADAGANIRFWTTSKAPAAHFATPYARIEALVEFPSEAAVEAVRTTLDEMLVQYDGAFDLQQGVCLD